MGLRFRSVRGTLFVKGEWARVRAGRGLGCGMRWLQELWEAWEVSA